MLLLELPDLRGEFIRGIKDGRSGVDETGGTAHTGSGGPTFSTTSILRTQTEGYKSHDHDSNLSNVDSGSSSVVDVDDPGHTHAQTGGPDGDTDSGGNANASDAGGTLAATGNSDTGIDIDIAATVDVNNSGSTETRPRNVALLACIKY